MRKIYFLTVLLGLVSLTSFSQSYSISGEVRDAGRNLISGANVMIPELNKGTVTNSKGEYQLNTIPEGSYTLKVTYLGFETIEKLIEVSGDMQLDVTLNEANYMLDGIMVSAQKREQMNKEVPIAITSYGGKFLESTNTFEYDALSEFVPGLQIQIQSVNNPGIVIRGITSDSGDSRVEPRVSVFQDGVSISKSRGSVVELYDMERVEVLKGPQGTLFGRGAQIGAIHLIQNKARNEKSGFFKAAYGNYNQRIITGHVNTPVIEDKLFVRFAGIYNARDGFIDNLSGGNLNGKETLAFRTSLKYLMGERTTLDVIAKWQSDTPPGTSFKSGTFAPRGGTTNPNTFADLERGEALGLDREVWGITGILKHDFNENWDLTSITAYRQFDSDEAFDADGTAAPVLFFREQSEGKQFSQELRFNFDTQDKFRGFFGVNFFAEDGSQSIPFETNEQSYALLLLNIENLVVNGVPQFLPTIPNNPAFGPLAGAPLLEFNKERSTNFGKNYSGDIFVDGSYDITTKLTATLGLRATWENINAGLEVENADQPGLLGNFLGSFPNNLFAPTNGRRSASENFTSAVGRFALDYDFNDEISVFGNIARGRRPNVINVTASNVDVLSDETVWSYEVGFKSLFLKNRLQFDANAFYYDYQNFQTTIARLDSVDGLVIIPNDSGSATSYGFETSFQYAVSKDISFFANYGYIDATFDDVDEDGNEQALAGNRFRLTPEHSFSLGGNIGFPLSDRLEGFFLPTYSFKSEVFFEETNLPNISQEAYGLLNLRAGLRLDDTKELTFFMTNALDEEFIIDAGNTGGAFGIPTFIAGPPRFFGAQFSIRF
ncbi:TonB-dependent receptor [Psychroflexus sediminis]|uniref:Outer membrane receptor proteins, mostly Fe transport n=1 Tax=Psychroflexus sediminis TaxID=470826 RepID=A0A1G7VBH3_9FLAO|nr:TonB-dependent receptor [Psychroflexus sediminis]SDG56310.1 Outer membrane receptor proteins, mostly Fe transport [Psychroflexus sediminis]